MGDEVLIGVGTDSRGWYREVVRALEQARSDGAPIRVTLIDLHSHDWVRNARGYDAVVWNPGFMGPISASFMKEKIHFLQNVVGVRIMPNFESVWHFESKVAQSYILDALDVPRPRTVVSFEYEDAASAAKELGLPVVAKKSFGASSQNVMLIRTQAELDRYLEREFAQQLWDDRKLERGSALGAAMSGPLSPALREKLRRRVMSAERHGYVYLQEFIGGNDSDLRLYIVGRRVVGCRRPNRENDFRASGSHREIMLDSEMPRDAVDLCMDIRERMGADFLAFDVLYKDDRPLIVEMSYAEDPNPINPGHWVREADGSYTRIEGEIWDHALWAAHVLDEFGL